MTARIHLLSPRARGVALLAALTLAASAAHAVTSDILPSNRRLPTVQTALALAAVPKVPPLPAGLPNPFFPPGFSTPDAAELKALAAAGLAPAKETKPQSEAQILSSIADWLNPSGTLHWEGSTYLLVREKKLKVGDHLTITFEGHDYDVAITAIDSSSFSLRLNHTEITRPLNPGTSP